MDDKKYKKQIIYVVLLIIFTILAILILVKMKNLNNSEEIIIDKNLSCNECNSASSNTDLMLKVDVRGAVNEPGVYEFLEGATIEDALEKAGGLSEESDIYYVDKNLNRASKLVDEQKVYVPANGEIINSYEGSMGEDENSYSDKININTSTKEEIMNLPGIGDVYADRIIESRPYKKVEDIKNVKGIGDSIYEKIEDKIKV